MENTLDATQSGCLRKGLTLSRRNVIFLLRSGSFQSTLNVCSSVPCLSWLNAFRLNLTSLVVCASIKGKPNVYHVLRKSLRKCLLREKRSLWSSSTWINDFVHKYFARNDSVHNNGLLTIQELHNIFHSICRHGAFLST